MLDLDYRCGSMDDIRRNRFRLTGLTRTAGEAKKAKAKAKAKAVRKACYVRGRHF